MPPDSGPAVRPLAFWLSGRWWRRDAHGTKVFPCPTCSGSIRETVDMVCQTCGTDYGITRKLRAVDQAPKTSMNPVVISDRLEGTDGT